MSKFTKDFEFKLSDELTYASQEFGEKKTTKLVLFAPSNSDKKIATKLRYIIINNMSKQSSVQQSNIDKKADTAKIEKNDLKTFVMAFIYNLPEDEMERFKELFWDLMYQNKCLIDNKTPINSHLAEKISLDDEDELIGEYIANFILPSWMKREMMS